MNEIIVSDAFDSGNIRVVDVTNPSNIRLAIRKDNASDFLQWFHFRLEGDIGQRYEIIIENAGKSSYPNGWPGYDVCTSWDRQAWFRTPGRYLDGTLSFEIELGQRSVYFAYFAPYSHDRHLDLLAWAEADDRVQGETLGLTVDGRAMSLLTVCDSEHPIHKVWIIARQHPGETMAEWFMEGVLHGLLDRDNPISIKLLQSTAFYLVPNMNPDGSVRGNLRTNAAGANLNREWQTPSMETSPEVFLVRDRMIAEGGNIFLDVHGDEELPYNFVSGCEGNLSYSQHHARMESIFKESFMAISPDFQDVHGYPKDKPGKANMTIAANWLGDNFNTLSYTIEMPFKDNADLPNQEVAWSPDRAAQLGRDVLFPISQVLNDITE